MEFKVFAVWSVFVCTPLTTFATSADLYEQIYQEAVKSDRRDLALAWEQYTDTILVETHIQKKYIWDFFPERFICAEGVERTQMGPATEWDGGKWLCGMRNLLQREGCVVYSFGSRGETDFEQTILNRTKCRVYTFDPTLDSTAVQRVRGVKRLNFLPFGLTSQNRSYDAQASDDELGEVHSLPEIMASFGHTTVDVLKIDVEGNEHRIISEWQALYAGRPPVTQLLVELHYGNMSPHLNVTAAAVRDTLVTLQDQGYKVFHREPNYMSLPLPYNCWEYSYIRTEPLSQVELPGAIPPSPKIVLPPSKAVPAATTAASGRPNMRPSKLRRQKFQKFRRWLQARQ